ncbi:hypothetical protein BP5796_11562 [Coleophoma crateriformis]|uniref:Zn(2)-C6 fungal-type domain-containing protein n=1 Tax=Coleophoma crateriformis TaxID=565419 RepID=A0A3D8QJ25_9HELO|nr:hypothetical protein BP5796_11562 [Coleophoma crateriformis]
MDGDSNSLTYSAHLDTDALVTSPIPSPTPAPTQPPIAAPAPVPVPVPPPATSSTEKRKQKKVRSACERCRYKRVKCDGQVPSCGNCSKAGALCVDVDSHDAEKKMMRGSSEYVAARIAWLESIIRTQLPHINLDDHYFAQINLQGQPELLGRTPGIANNLPLFDLTQPHPSLSSITVSDTVQEHATSASGVGSAVHPDPTVRGTKRPLAAMDVESPFRVESIDQDARSVALELGLLSLNSNSRQVHYLGSSSGSLFAPLLFPRKSGTSLWTDPSRLGSSRDTSSGKARMEAQPGMHTASHTSEMEKINLPPREECNILLSRFFGHMHPNHPFLHRPSFTCAVDALYHCAAAPEKASFQYNGWPTNIPPFPYNGEEYILQGQKLITISAHVAAFQLLIALSIGATLQIRSRKYTHNPKAFFNSAISISNHVFDSISLPVLQAVLLTIVHSLIDPDGCDAWTLTHIAMAHAVDLGIHREVSRSSDRFSPTSIEIRRRVFYCVYSLDCSISTIQGRPLGLGDDTFDVQLPDLSKRQSQSMDSQNSSDELADTATLSYSIQSFKMARFISRIKSTFYRLPVYIGNLDGGQDFTCIQDQLRDGLGQWLAESLEAVTKDVSADQRLRLTTKLQIQYHGAMCLLHQPSQVIAHPNDSSLQICFSSATKRLRLFETLYDSGALCHSWRTVQDIFLAGATVMYCVFISLAVRQSVSVSTLSRDFRACSSMLSVGGEWWPTVRKAKFSLERLSNHILDMLAETSRSDSAELRLGHQPFPQDYIPPNMLGWPEPETLGFNGIEQTLLNLINHNGSLIDIFDATSMNGLLDGIPEQLQTNHRFDTTIWDGFEQVEY